jgi:hypothetical protein
MTRRSSPADAQLLAADALGRTILHPDVGRVLNDYKRLTSDDDRAHYADHFLSRTAGAIDRIWPAFYELLKRVEDGELYRRPSYIGARTFGSFREYFEERVGRPFETWAQMENTYHYAQRYAPELLTKSLREATAVAQRAAEMPDDPEKINAGPGPLTKEEKANPHNIRITEAGYGTNADYLTRRIARDHPDILERMKAGEYRSVRAAALEAGIVSRTQTVRIDNPHSAARTLRRHMTPDNVAVLAELLGEVD